jgi:hypothetical protein
MFFDRMFEPRKKYLAMLKNILWIHKKIEPGQKMFDIADK